MIFWDLFAVFFKIGLFSFGGGYAMLALIQDEVVNVHQWISVGRFTDIIAISQVTPGPIAINCATYIGYQTTGSVWGSALATIGVSLPSVIITTLLFFFFSKYRDHPIIQNAFRGLKPTVVGLIFGAALMLMNGENFIDWYSLLLFAGAVVLSLWKNLNPILLISIAAAAGCALYL